MSTDERRQTAATEAAEEILRLIFGDDLTGCPVRLETVSGVVLTALRTDAETNVELLDLYGKSIEALQLLSRPPDASQIANPVELQLVLSDRLDAIHALTQKLTTMAAAADPT